MTSDAWYEDGLSFECQQCGGCCGGFPGFVWVTDEEAAAIAAHLGIDVEAFNEKYTKRVMSRRTLREVANYDCVMLENGGCSIYEVRPIQCRTFPFWREMVHDDGGWNEEARSLCEGVGRGRVYSIEEAEVLMKEFEESDEG